jgi:excisionase family DNA binding protein
MPDLASKPVRRVETRDTSFERLLDSDEAAALLKIHPKTLQKMARNGDITAVQIGRLWRFRASVLNDWLEHKMAS